MEKDIVFQPHKTIESSPLKENAFSQCVNTINRRGYAGVNFSTQVLQSDNNDGDNFTFTRDTIYISLTSALSGWETGVAVQFTTTGTLPTGISTSTTYYLRKINASTFKVHPTYDDARDNTNGISLTSDGTGTHTAERITLKEVVKIQNNYIIDIDGNFWKTDVNHLILELISKGNGDGVGLEVYSGYVYLFRDAVIDRWEILTETLDSNWQNDAGGVSLVDKENIMYIANGSTIRSYDGSTYNATALDIINSEEITCISEIGQYLSIGTDDNKIYLWDKSFTTFETPLDLPGIPKMLIPFGNLNYIILDNGDIYYTNGTTAVQILEFPKHILNRPDNPRFILSPNAYRVENNSILIGFGSTTNTTPIGIYEFNVNTKEFKLAYTTSSFISFDEANEIKFTAIQNKGDFYSAWSSDYLGGGGEDYNTVDFLSSTKRYEKSIIYSPFYRVGTKRTPRTLRHFDILLGNPLINGQYVSLYYRETLNGNWLSIGTFNELNKFSHTLDKSITVENLQLKLEIYTNQDENTPYAEEVRAYD